MLTDSRGVQEEACILGVPCVTLRGNTERPETVDVGANVMAGTGAAEILTSAREMLSRRSTWKNPYGDGMAGKMIATICGGLLGEMRTPTESTITGYDDKVKKTKAS